MSIFQKVGGPNHHAFSSFDWLRKWRMTYIWRETHLSLLHSCGFFAENSGRSSFLCFFEKLLNMKLKLCSQACTEAKRKSVKALVQENHSLSYRPSLFVLLMKILLYTIFKRAGRSEHVSLNDLVRKHCNFQSILRQRQKKRERFEKIVRWAVPANNAQRRNRPQQFFLLSRYLLVLSPTVWPTNKNSNATQCNTSFKYTYWEEINYSLLLCACLRDANYRSIQVQTYRLVRACHLEGSQLNCE